MRSSGLVLAALWLVWALPAVAQESAAPAPLPEGNTGIAAKYPGDRGIENDSAVVLVDRFEDNLGRWDSHYGNVRITHDPENVRSGEGALELLMEPLGGRGSSNRGLIRHFTPGHDVMHFRYYARFGKDTELYHGGTHNGPSIAAKAPGVPAAAAGIPADGFNHFTARLDNWRTSPDIPSPGYLCFYSYYPEQATRWGDQLFPSGRMNPVQRPPEELFGKGFVPRPDVIPERDRWDCYEIMVQSNTPGKRDGRMAFWVNGKLAADFPNFRMRDVETLKPNMINMGLFTQNRRVQTTCVVWHDDVIVATSYIGPMVENKNVQSQP